MRIELKSDSWRWFIIVAALTGMVAWLVASIALVAPDDQGRAASAQQQRTQQPTAMVSPIAGENQNDANKSAPHWYSFLWAQTTVQWILAVFAGFTLFAVNSQARSSAEAASAMRDSVQQMRLQHRAWLGLESLNVDDAISPDGNVSRQYQLHLKNFGHTAATNVRLRYTLGYSMSVDKMPLTGLGAIVGERVLGDLPPQSTAIIPFPFDSNMANRVLQTHVPYVRGRFDYEHGCGKGSTTFGGFYVGAPEVRMPGENNQTT